MTVKGFGWIFLDSTLAVKAALGHEKIGDANSRGPFTQEMGTRAMVETRELFPKLLNYFWHRANV